MVCESNCSQVNTPVSQANISSPALHTEFRCVHLCLDTAVFMSNIFLCYYTHFYLIVCFLSMNAHFQLHTADNLWAPSTGAAGCYSVSVLFCQFCLWLSTLQVTCPLVICVLLLLLLHIMCTVAFSNLHDYLTEEIPVSGFIVCSGSDVSLSNKEHSRWYLFSFFNLTSSTHYVTHYASLTRFSTVKLWFTLYDLIQL